MSPHSSAKAHHQRLTESSGRGGVIEAQIIIEGRAMKESHDRTKGDDRTDEIVLPATNNIVWDGRRIKIYEKHHKVAV